METPVNTARVERATFRARNTVPFALALAAVAAFSFLSGGYVLGRNTPVAVALLCAAAVWVWFLRRSTRPPVVFLVALAVFAAFVVWSGLSVLWSVGPDLTWVSFNLAAFYLAVVAVLGLTSARALQLRTVAYGYLAVAAGDGRLRVPRQGAAGRGDARAHLRPAGQSRRLLERAGAHDGDGPVSSRWRSPATARPAPLCARSPPRPRCRCASPSSSPSRAAAGSRSPWRSSSTSPSRPRGWPAS